MTCRNRNGDAVVSIGGGDHTMRSCCLIERLDFVRSATQFERSGLLQVLHFEQDFAGCAGKERGYILHGGLGYQIANAPVSLGKMIGMRLRKVPVGLIVDNRITAVKAGLDVRSDPLEAHYLAGGDVNHVVLALIAADTPMLDRRTAAATLTASATTSPLTRDLRASRCTITLPSCAVIIAFPF